LDQFFGFFCFAYDTSEYSKFGTPPFSLTLREPPPAMLEYMHLSKTSKSASEVCGGGGGAARTVMDSAHEVIQKYHRKRLLDCDQQDTFFQPFEIGDMVWVKNRGATADGLKKMPISFIIPFFLFYQYNSNLNVNLKHVNGSSDVGKKLVTTLEVICDTHNFIGHTAANAPMFNYRG
jgi:hypothetical protein